MAVWRPSYAHISCGKVNVNTANVKVNVNKVNVKVNVIKVNVKVHDILLFIATTKVAAVGRHHRRGAAASGRGTSSVVSFVAAMDRVSFVAVTTILVSYVVDH